MGSRIDDGDLSGLAFYDNSKKIHARASQLLPVHEVA